MASQDTQKSQLPVVILCGGQGTRLREETEVRPKPMVEIGGMPILWHIMKIYGHFDISRFILCLGYKGWVIKQYFLRYHEMMRDFTVSMDGAPDPVWHNRAGEERWRVTCSETGETTGTGGRLYRVRDYIDSDTFFSPTETRSATSTSTSCSRITAKRGGSPPSPASTRPHATERSRSRTAWLRSSTRSRPSPRAS